MRIPDGNTARVRIASQEIFQASRGSKGGVLRERNSGSAKTVFDVVDAAAPDFAAPLQAVISADVRNVIGERIIHRRILQRRPAGVSAHWIEGADSDYRHAEVPRIRNSRIDSISCRVYVGVRCGDQLLLARVGKLGLIDPFSARSPNPTQSKHLRTSDRLRLPFRLQNGLVLFKLGATADEIVAADGVVIVQAVIDFRQPIVSVVGIGEADVQLL